MFKFRQGTVYRHGDSGLILINHNPMQGESLIFPFELESKSETALALKHIFEPETAARSLNTEVTPGVISLEQIIDLRNHSAYSECGDLAPQECVKLLAALQKKLSAESTEYNLVNAIIQELSI
ncbi:MAG: hypothetical protein RR060_06940 [Victivallaceae bacterium]